MYELKAADTVNVVGRVIGSLLEQSGCMRADIGEGDGLRFA